MKADQHLVLLMFLLCMLEFGQQKDFTVCPTHIVKSCITTFNSGVILSDDICSEVRELHHCVDEVSVVCASHDSYQHARKLAETHGFLKCYCPTKQIRNFIDFYESVDMCRFRGFFMTFLITMDRPICHGNADLLRARELKVKLDSTCPRPVIH